MLAVAVVVDAGVVGGGAFAFAFRRLPRTRRGAVESVVGDAAPCLERCAGFWRAGIVGRSVGDRLDVEGASLGVGGSLGEAAAYPEVRCGGFGRGSCFCFFLSYLILLYSARA